MTFAKRLFWLAGLYGVTVVVPIFFLEAKWGRDYPPPITHPEFYYGFAGVGLAWQIAFFIIAKNPLRYRAIMIPGAFEKLSFASAASVLFWQGRTSAQMFGFGMIDLLLAILFLIAFVRLKQFDSAAE